MKPKPPATMRDVAKAVGVSTMTISRVLRRQRHAASPELSQRIRATAKRLGYKPNPLVSALMSERAKKRQPGHDSVIAWIMSESASAYPMTAQALEGARARAQELGFRIEVFSPESVGHSGAKLRKILQARGILGCIVSLWIAPEFIEDMGLEHFAWATQAQKNKVCFGISFVGVDHGRYSEIAVETAAAMGYQRPGFFSTLPLDQPYLRLLLKAVALHALIHQYQPLRPYFVGESPRPQAFREWAQRERPDVILLMSKESIREWQAIPPAERKPYGWIYLGAAPDHPELAQITHNIHDMGRALVDRISAALYRNEFGPRHEPDIVLKDVSFVPGASLPEQIRA